MLNFILFVVCFVAALFLGYLLGKIDGQKQVYEKCSKILQDVHNKHMESLDKIQKQSEESLNRSYAYYNDSITRIDNSYKELIKKIIGYVLANEPIKPKPTNKNVN